MKIMKTSVLLMGLMVLVFVMSGCKTVRSPIDAFYKSTIAGDGYKNAMSQMESIVRHASIVYDPEITDAEFDAWLARHNSTTRRFQSMLEIYKAFAPANESQSTAELESVMSQREAELKSIIDSR